MSTIQDIDREAARRVARVLGEDADAEAPGSDGGSGDAVPSPSSQHAATMDEARTKAKHTSRVVGRAWPYVPRILALAAVVAAISGLLQIDGNSKHGRTRTGSLGKSGPGDPDDPQGVPEMKNTIQRQVMAAAVTAAVGATANAQQAVQWRVEDGGNGHWYRVTTTNFSNWSTAHLAAEAGGAHLATISNESEWNFIRPRAIGCYLGGYQDPTHPDWSEPAGGWRWVTGEVWSVGPWAGFGPDDAPCHINNGDRQQDVLWLAFETGGILDDIEANPVSYCPLSLEKPAVFEWSADCNNDGIVDYGQILSGQLADADTNGVPDTCECPCDVFRDNAVNGIDLGVLLGQWGEVTQYTVTDFNRDGAVDGSDLGQLLAAWGPCPS